MPGVVDEEQFRLEVRAFLEANLARKSDPPIEAAGAL